MRREGGVKRAIIQAETTQSGSLWGTGKEGGGRRQGRGEGEEVDFEAPTGQEDEERGKGLHSNNGTCSLLRLTKSK
jgi:hypothetical protein